MKKIVGILCMMAIMATASAQLSYGPIWKVGYDVGLPSGDFSSNYIGEPGWRGFSLKGNWFFADQFTFGAYVGWNGFYEKNDRETYYGDGEAITGTRMKYMYTMPVLATVQYVMVENEKFNPYFSLGAGPYYIQQEDQIGRFVSSTKEWRFGLNPEVGVMFPFNIDVGFFANLGYNVVFYNQRNISNLGYFSLSVGLYFN